MALSEKGKNKENFVTFHLNLIQMVQDRVRLKGLVKPPSGNILKETLKSDILKQNIIWKNWLCVVSSRPIELDETGGNILLPGSNICKKALTLSADIL